MTAMEQATLVRVTREHIARGKRCDCEKCPVALALIGALGDLLPTWALVEVDWAQAQIHLSGGEIWDAIMPPAAKNFIIAFDDGDDAVGPFEFTLTWRPIEWGQA